METNEDNQNEERPSAPELLGASAEQIKRQGEPTEQYAPDPEAESRSDSKIYQLYIGVASLVLLLLGLAALGIWFFAGPDNDEVETTENLTPSSIIYAERKEEVEIQSFSNLHNQVARLSNENLRQNSFSQIFFTQVIDNQKTLVSGETLLNQLANNNPSIARYVADNFMYGTYKDADGEESRYIIFGITQYENAYGTMLQTEETFVSALTALGFPLVDEFRDVLIQNQDVRVAGGAGGTRLFYSFPRQNRLVVTTSESALREIFDRLRRR